MLSAVPPTECMRAREGASARVDGELAELESAWLDGHLRTCHACRDFAERIGGTAAALRVAVLEPAPAELFVVRRRRLAMPIAAVAATLAIAVTAGTSFLVGQQLGARNGHSVTIGTTAKEPGVDPGMLAMLGNRPMLPRADRRVVAV
jgi:predicted anti-sigma-YlaC factor YlaD